MQVRKAKEETLRRSSGKAIAGLCIQYKTFRNGSIFMQKSGLTFLLVKSASPGVYEYSMRREKRSQGQYDPEVEARLSYVTLVKGPVTATLMK